MKQKIIKNNARQKGLAVVLISLLLGLTVATGLLPNQSQITQPHASSNDATYTFYTPDRTANNVWFNGHIEEWKMNYVDVSIGSGFINITSQVSGGVTQDAGMHTLVLRTWGHIKDFNVLRNRVNNGSYNFVGLKTTNGLDYPTETASDNLRVGAWTYFLLFFPLNANFVTINNIGVHFQVIHTTYDIAVLPYFNALVIAIEQAEVRILTNYTILSGSVVFSALSNAQASISFGHSSILEMQALRQNLIDTQNNLVSTIVGGVNLRTLRTQRQNWFNTRNPDNYTPASWAAFQTALTNANSAINSAPHHPAVIDAFNALNDAVLVLISEFTPRVTFWTGEIIHTYMYVPYGSVLV